MQPPRPIIAVRRYTARCADDCGGPRRNHHRTGFLPNHLVTVGITCLCHTTAGVLDMAPASTFGRCMMWCMKRTNIYLDEEQTAALDRLAAQEGVSRAELIRRLLGRVLGNADDSVASDLHAIDDSFGALLDIDTPVRGEDDRDHHLARMWRHSS